MPTCVGRVPLFHKPPVFTRRDGPASAHLRPAFSQTTSFYEAGRSRLVPPVHKHFVKTVVGRSRLSPPVHKHFVKTVVGSRLSTNASHLVLTSSFLYHISSAFIWVQVSVMEKPSAQDSKRKASNALRELASELQLAERGRNYDHTKAQFASLLEHVEVQCSTPDQRRRAQEAKALYFETATFHAAFSVRTNSRKPCRNSEEKSCNILGPHEFPGKGHARIPRKSHASFSVRTNSQEKSCNIVGPDEFPGKVTQQS